MNYGPLIFLVLGLALCVVGIYWFSRQRQFVARAMRATGKIVAVHKARGRDIDDGGVATYAPVVRFKDAVGREVEFTSSFASSGMQKRVGEQVEVLYDPDQPSSASLASGAALWLGPAIVLVIGLAFAAFGGGFSAMTQLKGFFNKPSGDVGQLAGQWTNIDPRTPGITRVTISSGGVRVWGRCRPQDCDWGAPASYGSIDGAKGSMALSWDHKFARREQQLTLLGDGRLQVTTQTRFVDRSKRADRDSTEYFARDAR